MVDSIQNELARGDYVGAIQYSLGNGGASAKMEISGSQRSVLVTGTPTGLPHSSAPSPASVVSFSPEAQRILSNDQIALSVILANRPDHSGRPAPANPQMSDEGTAPQAVPPTASQAVSQGPAPSISEIVNDAQAAMKDPTSVFYQSVDQVGGAEAYAAFMSDDEQRQSFIDAFNNHSLIIQNASDVAGLDYQDNTVLTGTSEIAGGSMNEQWIASQDASNGTYSTGLFLPVIGGIYVTWANPSANSAAATSAVAAGGS